MTSIGKNQTSIDINSFQGETKITITEEMSPDPDNSLGFIFVPLIVLITIMLLSAMVYMMARNKRKFSNFYKTVHIPNFNFESSSDLEDNDDPTECLLRGKLHIDNSPSYNHYQVRTLNERRELYT